MMPPVRTTPESQADLVRFPSPPPGIQAQSPMEEPRGDATGLLEQRKALGTAIELASTPGQEIARGGLDVLASLHDLSWRQREAFPGHLAQRAVQGAAIGAGSYVLYRLARAIFLGK